MYIIVDITHIVQPIMSFPQWVFINNIIFQTALLLADCITVSVSVSVLFLLCMALPCTIADQGMHKTANTHYVFTGLSLAVSSDTEMRWFDNDHHL